MPSRSPFAKRSSTRHLLPAALVAGTVVAALVAVTGWPLDTVSLAVAGLIAATALAGAFAVFLIVSERRRHESAEDELQGRALFLESLVSSLAALSRTLDPDEILARACGEAERLFDARSARFVAAGDSPPGERRAPNGRLVVPLALRGELIGALELERARDFHRSEVIAATVLADFTSRAVENARLLAEAREREAERERLTERLITAEQDERRRLSLFLHDGPLQAMSGIALMHDAALAALQDGRDEDAQRVIVSALERERETIRTLRNLSFAIEPVVLRDQGFVAAVHALRDQVEEAHRISVSADVEAGERLSEKAQVALYQIIREAIGQAVQRKPQHVEISVVERPDGGFAAEIADDGMGERRRASVDAIDERVRVLNGRLSVGHRNGGGTAVRVVLPAYVAAPPK